MPQLKAIPSDVLLTPERVADFLSVSKETLAQWRSKRRGPRYIKLENRLVRYCALSLKTI
jgi:DNA-binding transcriptional regulator YiaG